MFLREIRDPPDSIAGIGSRWADRLAGAGIRSAAELLCYYPRSYEDRSRLVPIAGFRGAPVCTLVTVILRGSFYAGGKRITKIYVEDESGRAALLCFNPFKEKGLLPGSRHRLWGHFGCYRREIQTSNFETEALEVSADGGDAGPEPSGKFGLILPVYRGKGGLKSWNFRLLIRHGLDQYAAALDDELPESIVERDSLLPKARALEAIHFPPSMEELEKARKTLIYEELFYLEIITVRRAMERRSMLRSPAVSAVKAGQSSRARPGAGTAACPWSPLQRRLVERLPFPLTPGQRGAAAEINRDMDGPCPMARLLQGDVGSGKTLVSFLAALKAAESGGQTALMAPTELLARQHAENAARLLEPLGLQPAFLTGGAGAAGRKEILKSIAAGETDIIIGTHALFSADVVYRNLRLVIIDEQHRFGVMQRNRIMEKGAPEGPASAPSPPDLLMMSATPIPRTLALTVFGDMDVSVIRDMPPGRKPVETHLARGASESRVYEFVRRELAAGRQAYFVYPLIEALEDEENPAAAIKDAASMYRRLSTQIFPEFSAALIHSKVEEEKKQRIMEDFRRGKIRILTATSVVEVGVDVPNANCMVIEHAERFGLSALHQLRGRVGRGADQAYCFLIYADNPGLSATPEWPGGRPGGLEFDSQTPALPEPGAALTKEGKKRLRVMLENTDGFVIAEEDLKLRGPGLITGVEQSGYLPLGIADPLRDLDELVRARADALAILDGDPGLLLPDHRRITEVLTRAPLFAELVM
ncbi:MAG: ATP-dependent DNA helicase RecG [Treponema sp.]|jgi:ATP-dependent DNA helicase RecG|nr:ATP-dependent DNA helicase RecG [Treponema sp.]